MPIEIKELEIQAVPQDAPTAAAPATPAPSPEAPHEQLRRMQVELDGRLRRRGSSRITLIMASFGVALMLRNIVVIFFGPEPIYYAFAIQPALRLWGIRITPNEIVVVAVTAALVVCLHLFLTRTRLGKSMRAVSESPSLARVTGINVDVVIRWTWLIGSGLAAIGGVSTWFARQNHFEWMFNPLPDPTYAPASLARFMDDRDMVIAVETRGDAVAWPVRQMAYHHIVEAIVGGIPVVSTY